MGAGLSLKNIKCHHNHRVSVHPIVWVKTIRFLFLWREIPTKPPQVLTGRKACKIQTNKQPIYYPHIRLLANLLCDLNNVVNIYLLNSQGLKIALLWARQGSLVAAILLYRALPAHMLPLSVLCVTKSNQPWSS